MFSCLKHQCSGKHYNNQLSAECTVITRTVTANCIVQQHKRRIIGAGISRYMHIHVSSNNSPETTLATYFTIFL